MPEKIDNLIETFDLSGDWTELQSTDLKDELVKRIGANFELSIDSHKSLKKVTNIGSLKGVVDVVGDHFYQKYVLFCDQWVKNYESDKKHRNLPKMINIDPTAERKSSGSKTVGMRHFLHYLISYTSGDMKYSQVKKYMEVMDRNGYLWQERSFDKDRTEVEFNGKTIKIGSIPPGFSKDAWNFIKTYKN